MQRASVAYGEAIAGNTRKIIPLAIIDLIGPDIAYSSETSSGESTYSKSNELYDRIFDAEKKYGTLEQNRFLLDETFSLYPESPEDVNGEHGFLSDDLCGSDGFFANPVFVQLNISNVDLLQAAAVYFTGIEGDGVARDMTFEVYRGEEILYQQTIVDNKNNRVDFDGFTVENVTAVRLTVLRWSIPYRRFRLLEFVLGFYDEWYGDMIYNVDVLQETAFDCMTVPYGTCTLEILNKDKVFNPFNKNGLFRSIEARQGVPVRYGAQLTDGTIEYLPLGVYYQRGGGWETDAYGLTITFKLVDIVGLISDKKFIVPDRLPTTLVGWIEAIVSHLGINFKKRYVVASEVAEFPLETTVERLKDLDCGEVLRYACMAAQAFFRADNATGYLRVEPISDVGHGIEIGLNNMHSYPKNKATDGIAQISFRLADSTKTEYIVEGSRKTTGKSLNINNPFISTTTRADAVAAYIMHFYGLTQFTVYGRGDMRCELGDIDSAETGFGDYATGRRYKQQLKFSNGVLKNAPSYLLSDEKIVTERR